VTDSGDRPTAAGHPKVFPDQDNGVHCAFASREGCDGRRFLFSGFCLLHTTKAKLGFIALTDAAPLFVADEKGFFKKHGMTDVEVLKQSSWGTTRDNLVLGSARATASTARTS
jgi:ABC-type nitrate/sulfonate/bicarbonate transport system substrate-binding protein